jgi:hypothetical protein
MAMSVSQLVAFHRRLGCDDESSTDDEQAERILYFHPEQTAVNVQLSRVGMLQSMVDFSEKLVVSSIPWT